MEPSLALQKTIRTRLISAPAFVALVPAANVLDRHGRPERDPLVIVGEGQSIYADDYEDFADRAAADLHVYVEEAGLDRAKAIAGEIRVALKGRPWIVEGFNCVNLAVSSARFMRDPDHQHSHGVVTVEAILQVIT